MVGFLLRNLFGKGNAHKGAKLRMEIGQEEDLQDSGSLLVKGENHF